MATITGIDIQDMVRHWLNTPVGAYLGSSYGSNIKDLLQRPQADGLADVVIAKMRVDIPILQSLPSGAINIYSATSAPDKRDLFIDVAGQVVQVPGRPVQKNEEIHIDIDPPSLVISSEFWAVNSKSTSVISFQFSESVGNTFTRSDISVSVGTLGELSGSGLVKTALFTSPENYQGDAVISVSGEYSDSAGNSGASESITISIIDTTPPTLVMTSESSSVNVFSECVVYFSFSKDVGPSFNESSISVSGGEIGQVIGSGLNWSVVFTALSPGQALISVENGAYSDATPSMNPGIGSSTSINVIDVPRYYFTSGLYGFIVDDAISANSPELIIGSILPPVYADIESLEPLASITAGTLADVLITYNAPTESLEPLASITAGTLADVLITYNAPAPHDAVTATTSITQGTLS